ncbi:Protein of unknown function [Bryocella elongata]|uniref:DUF3050 domain-containing protein n=1 Tax=Bryocella elongata TaxID=863522 RepID=A0A1H5YPD0_9BACT|nr:DUF3050 domain-containing protein [Bryocella elongata]SEG25973.1 Protein of unknown function [Bryocella elongata]
MSSSTSALAPLDLLESRIAPLRERLASHPIYSAVSTERDLRLFMESHVFAVWDFMSLLKSLQRALTCVDVPWVPSRYAASRRFINEIVLGEESDEYQHRPLSHFEIYLEAMQVLGADNTPIETLINAVRTSGDWKAKLAAAPIPAQAFVAETFRVIEHGSIAAQAAAFTFGREDVIPEMFRGMVRELNDQREGRLAQFVWYLERHIEVDGDDHGPLSLKMVSDLCGTDEALWAEATSAAEQALAARLALWDGVLAEIQAGR